MRTWSAALVAIFAAGMLTGCVRYRANLRSDGLVATPRVDLRDQRPGDQKGSGNESLFIGSCAYAIYRMGDDLFVPDRVQLLRSDLDRALGAELAGRPVVLRNYTVHYNNSQQLRQSVDAFVGGKGIAGALAAEALNQKVYGCAADDLKGGSTGREKTTDHQMLVAVIDVEFEGKRIHSRVAESAPVDVERKMGEQVWHDFVSQVVRKATDNVVRDLRAALGSNAQTSSR